LCEALKQFKHAVNFILMISNSVHPLIYVGVARAVAAAKRKTLLTPPEANDETHGSSDDTNSGEGMQLDDEGGTVDTIAHDAADGGDADTQDNESNSGDEGVGVRKRSVEQSAVPSSDDEQTASDSPPSKKAEGKKVKSVTKSNGSRRTSRRHETVCVALAMEVDTMCEKYFLW
jgi:hypothetical protein